MGKQHCCQACGVLGTIAHDLVEILAFTATLSVRPHLVAHNSHRHPRANFDDLLLSGRGKSIRTVRGRVRKKGRSLALLDCSVNRGRDPRLAIRRVTTGVRISSAEENVVEKSNCAGVELIPHAPFGKLVAVAREDFFPFLNEVLTVLGWHHFPLSNIQEEDWGTSVQRIHRTKQRKRLVIVIHLPISESRLDTQTWQLLCG
mmetsp:Transcript_122709/g.281323  ORF Transcript_122709/g.281323 Transcript_122709/m.281323 type:complete len:202 (+) Transcript_122709:1816-2421(+)